MLLRASSQHRGQTVDLQGVMGAVDGDGGVPHGELLVAFAEAALGQDPDLMSEARQALSRALGEAGMVDAAAVAAGFNAIDRVADGTGIPIDEGRVASTASLRQDLGIDQFPSSKSGGTNPHVKKSPRLSLFKR